MHYLLAPHQLFNLDQYSTEDTLWLIEDPLLFSQYAFHKTKLFYHRATMNVYISRAQDAGIQVKRIEYQQLEDGDLGTILKKQEVDAMVHYDLCDDYITRSWHASLDASDIKFETKDSKLYYFNQEKISDLMGEKKTYFFHTIYKAIRKETGTLMDGDEPQGGSWSYDDQNRKKLPKDHTPKSLPDLDHRTHTEERREAKEYVMKNFSNNPGDIADIYPLDHDQAREWFEIFLKERLHHFGDYEDALHTDHAFIYHGVLTPMLNIGLLEPRHVIETSISYAGSHDIQINNVEGFVRQIIGWREYIRGLYDKIGSQQRTTNFWGHRRKIPSSFYDGTTGIDPVDHVIQSTLQHGYAHHIERLMVIGNFFLLCEVDPDEVYTWFMEMYIDAYDWVMVPNVYGMSQFADGGMMSTKPYTSGSNYLLKMSNYKKGSWCIIWDQLFWRFLDKHQEFYKKNPRMNMLLKQLEKPGKRDYGEAEAFLEATFKS